jgi:uncharacterized protein (UPF0332 family)
LQNQEGQPTECDLRRAQSTIYYALFHCLARDAADMLVGDGSAERSDRAWMQVYRALNHNTVFSRCDNDMIDRFPTAIQEIGYYFKAFQLKRHEADYSPVFEIDLESVRQDLDFARGVVDDFLSQPEKHRRAFAAYLIVEQRNGKIIKRRPRPKPDEEAQPARGAPAQ